MKTAKGKVRRERLVFYALVPETKLMELLAITRPAVRRLRYEGKLGPVYHVHNRRVRYLYQVTKVAAYAKSIGIAFDETDWMKGVGDGA